MVELMQRNIEALVDSPEYVRVRTVEAGELRILEVTVADDEIGLVIGRSGVIAEALRTLLDAWAGKAKNGRWQLEIAGERKPVRVQV